MIYGRFSEVKYERTKDDSEFQGLIPPLTEQEYEQLQENILADGCRDALVVWGNTIVDGHNRFRICTENDIKFQTVSKDFDSREDAIIWICKNQIGRRNITNEQKTYLIGKEQEARKNKRVSRDEYGRFAPEYQNGTTGKTAQVVADEHGIGYGTVIRAEKFSKAVDTLAAEAPDLKPLILSGKANLPKSTIVEIAQQDAPERARSIKDIKEGRRPAPTPKPRTDKPVAPRVKPTAEQNEATRYLSDLNRVEGMNTPDREAQRMCNDIKNSINLLMYAMKDVTFSELSPEVKTAEQEEARLYALQGGRRLTLIDKHKANIVAEDQATIEVEQILDEVGLRITKSTADGGVCAIKALQDTYASLGKSGLKRVLTVLSNTWDGAGISLQSGMINGMRQLYEVFGNDVDDMRLIRQLRKTHPSNILREANSYASLPKANAVASIFATYYNKNLRLLGSAILDVNRLYA